MSDRVVQIGQGILPTEYYSQITTLRRLVYVNCYDTVFAQKRTLLIPQQLAEFFSGYNLNLFHRKRGQKAAFKKDRLCYSFDKLIQNMS